MPAHPIRIAVISDNPDPGWAWLRDVEGADFTVDGRALNWTGFSTTRPTGPNFLRRFQGVRELATAHARDPFDIIVSHGPWITAWTQWFVTRGNAKHLAFSFNFTDLPTGLRKAAMARAFNKVDAFAVFTDAEQTLYSDYFSLDQQRLLRGPWGVAAPISEPTSHPASGRYYAALGGEARDYAILCETAQRLPEINFVAVARPRNFEGLDPPDNLKVFFDLPFDRAWSVVWDAAAAIIPLRSRETPCGLVTLVGGMHLGKAQIVTDAAGAGDYIVDGKTGLLFPAGDAQALAAKVLQIEDDPALAARLGEAARVHAGAQCSEAATVRFFKSLIEGWFGGN